MPRQSPPTRSLAPGPGTVLKPKLPRGLYAIADSQFGNPLLLGQALLNAGALTLQIRTKTWSTAERIQLGRALLPLATDLGALLIMNDDINAACELDIGLHLGQEDGPAEAARSRLGHHAIIGRSTHSLDQIRDLEPTIDYIGFGPMFTTQTKETGWSPRGIPLLQQAIACSSVPVVAIGGITSAHLPELRRSGVHAWAVISALCTPSVDPAVVATFL
jgi:thiamine-phosphate pyrophosphorylase